MAGLLLGAVAVAFLALLVAIFLKATPETLANLVRGGAAAALGAAAVILFLRGQPGLAFFAAAGVPAILGRKALQAFTAPPSPGQKSRVETPWLAMELDHDTGHSDGEVRQGPFAGFRLSDMTEHDLIGLLDHCRASDPQSAVLLEAYLDRVHPDWREQPAATGAGDSGGERPSGGPAGRAGLTREEAYAILGLQPGASDEEVREAHRQLMKKLHPDQGGSNYLASQINAAKDLLLGS
ncbi:MAG: DnaJ domain-containing protein [Alphaproteobacteria bacterium]|nr:DnaJ domain-containing protein [Alphaproteobacteria bacterium]